MRVYKRGRFAVVVSKLVVVCEGGKVLETFDIKDVAEAVETCDEMAEREEDRDAA